MRIIFVILLATAHWLTAETAIEKTAKIFVAGHRGLVGQAIVRKLKSEGFSQIITRTSSELDLRSREDVAHFFDTERPDFVFLAAAKVGGIMANWCYPVDFLRDNLLIQTNVLDCAYTYKTKKLLFLGSSCIYPRDCPQPIKEEYLLSGPLEVTNDAYALAKIAGIKLCQAYNRQYKTRFIACMPTNLYGPGDNFHSHNSHVAAALIRKFVEAKQNNLATVELWGTGAPRREFLHVDDLADACLHLMRHYEGDEIVNIGWGQDITIHELACLIKRLVGYQGTITYNSTKPDGTPQKLLDITKIQALGWSPKITLEQGFAETIHWYQTSEEVKK